MASIKLTNFLGELPKVSSELLPDGAAQNAVNVKFYSGNLLPYNEPKKVASTNRTNEAKTIYALRNPIDDTFVWKSWGTDVDIAVASSSADDDQRFYYTGDGKPKVSNYKLSTSGIGSYDLGLPIPTEQLRIRDIGLNSISSRGYSRNENNVATFYPQGDHEYRTGDIVTIYGFDDQAKFFNAKNVEITITKDNNIEYFNVGDNISYKENHSGIVTLAGNTQLRTYVYTWVTPWDEESIPSPVSNEVYTYSSSPIKILNMPRTSPNSRNFIRGVRLYRNITSASGSDYFLVGTFWFPTNVSSVSREANISTVTLLQPHNFIVGDRFRLYGCSNSSFNVTNGKVTEIVNDFTFRYKQHKTSVGLIADASGIVYHIANDQTFFWSGTIVDRLLPKELTTIIPSEDYDPPSETMKGLIVAYNNILAGFFNNQLCFSFPDKPHAWPEKYRITVESDIVAIAAISGYILVLTKNYPYQVSGNGPATMVCVRINALYPCVSKRSVVTMDYGVVWATHGGLAAWNPIDGINLITKYAHDWDTWNKYLNPASIVGHFYNNKYFGSDTNKSFIFEDNDKTGGFFTQIQHRFSAAYTDNKTNTMYYSVGNSGDIYEWDSTDQFFSLMEWKSKTIVTKDYINLGAFKVVADYTVSDKEKDKIYAYNARIDAYNQIIWSQSQQLGTINGPTDYHDSSTNYHPHGTLNSFALCHDPQTKYKKPIADYYNILFKLWVNKQLVFQNIVNTDNVFRLPTGYRSDTFEVEVSGFCRVQTIYLGETPYGLKVV